MKKILVLLLLVSTITLSAQRDEAYVASEIEKFSQSLEDRDINTYFYTQRFCSGSIEIIQLAEGRMCATKGTYIETYFFWEEEDTIMMKKIDNCGLFYSVELEDRSLWNFISSNWNSIKSSKVKNYETAQESDGPTQRTEIHPCKRAFSFSDPETPISIQYDLFDLTNDASQENIHYKSNNELTIVKLDKMLDTIITKNQSKLRRQK
ncbi:hypothetical protein [Patiriisocius hiemis]|uniref:Uncharacterized protein n=1 Tax=Patiriisocius hiemis TaxID=3075604 RepID=A0ABU2YBS2_9FLAO|nr:hypothetical protein [Constantimarinum sp. W242]MDT0555089.1 hypothetical protein [Constantimarinum sp. W242]